MIEVMLLQGPNLNLLGNRETNLYGNISLEQLHLDLQEQASSLDIKLDCKQSNSELELLTWLQQTTAKVIIFNPAGFTHTSVVLRDTLLAINKPFIEVHISNIYAREQFRYKSYFSDLASGIIIGCGINGYSLALQAVKHQFS